MKFNKIMAGWYRSEDKNVEITNRNGMWEIHAFKANHKKLYIGHTYSLKEAKAVAGNINPSLWEN